MFTGMLRLLLLTILFADTYPMEFECPPCLEFECPPCETPDEGPPPDERPPPDEGPPVTSSCNVPDCHMMDSCNAADIHCAGDDYAYSKVSCSGPNSCKEAAIGVEKVFCSGSNSCNAAAIRGETVFCSGLNSCKEAAIGGETVFCSGTNSCNAAAITCESQNTRIFCSGVDSCQNTRLGANCDNKPVYCSGDGYLTCSGLTNNPNPAKSITINRDIKSPYSDKDGNDTNDNMFKLMIPVIAVFVLICILVSIAMTNTYKYCCKYAVLVDTDGDKETDSENALIEFAK